MLSAFGSIITFDEMLKATKKGGFTAGDIARDRLQEHDIRAYIKFCIHSGAVEVVPERVTRAGRHVILYRAIAMLPPLQVVEDANRQALRQMLQSRLFRRRADADLARAQAQLWTALRALKVTEARSIAFHASTEDVRITPVIAAKWLSALFGAGYVADGGDGYFRLSPARNTGPYPVLAARGVVLDLNLLRAVNVTAQSGLHHRGRAA